MSDDSDEEAAEGAERANVAVVAFWYVAAWWGFSALAHAWLFLFDSGPRSCQIVLVLLSFAWLWTGPAAGAAAVYSMVKGELSKREGWFAWVGLVMSLSGPFTLVVVHVRFC